MLCLALAMGVNTTLFSFLDSMYFRKLPVPDAGRMVLIQRGDDEAFYPWRDFASVRDTVRLHGLDGAQHLRQPLAPQRLPHHGKERLLFLFDMVTDAFDEHRHLGVEPLLVRV